MWICRSENMCVSDPHLPSLVLTACLLVHKRGRQGKERRNSKFNWLFAGSSGQRFAVEEDEISDENIWLPFTEAWSPAVFSSKPISSVERIPPQRLCVIRQVILHNLLGGQRQFFHHLAGCCANLPATPPYRFSNTGHRNCEWRGEVAVIQVIYLRPATPQYWLRCQGS